MEKYYQYRLAFLILRPSVGIGTLYIEGEDS